MKVNYSYCLIIKIKSTIFTSNIKVRIHPRKRKILYPNTEYLEYSTYRC